MAQAQVSNDKLIANSPPTIDVSWTGFLKYKAPFDEPTTTLTYDIEYSLAEVIEVFQSMVFDDIEKLPERFKKLSKFTKRKCTFNEKGKSKTGEFAGNENGNLCQVLKFETTLLPLIPGFDIKEYEKKLKEKQAKEAQVKQEAASGWSSWTSVGAWKQWGSSMMDMEAWGNSLNSWMQYLNMNTDANELWKIDWIQHKAVSYVKNVTFSWTIGVYEYAELEQLMHIDADQDNEEKTDEKCKVKFIKKLFVHPIVPLPAFLLDLLKVQYKKDSDLQVSIINELCKQPLAQDDTNKDLQQLEDV